MINIHYKEMIWTLNLIFIFIFLGHIFTIGYKLVYPENPSVKNYNSELKNIDFPLAFKLCLFELDKSNDRYTKIGYPNVYWFFEGKSKFGEIFGWNGHLQNNLTLGSVRSNSLPLLIEFIRISSFRRYSFESIF